MDPHDPTPFSLGSGAVGALLIHGFSGTPGELRPLGEYLAGQGFAVEGPLLAGHGGTQEQLAVVRWHDWIASARAGFEALRGRCGTIVLVGFSMGGAIALRLAAQGQSEYAAIVTASTPLRLANPLLYLLPVARFVLPYAYPLRSVDLNNPAVLERLRDYMPELQIDPSNKEEIARLRRGVKVSVAAVYQLTLLLRATRPVVPRVVAPALLMHARRDEQIPISNLDTLYRRISSRDKRAVRFERSGHMLFAGPERQEAFAHVADFMRGVVSR